MVTVVGPGGKVEVKLYDPPEAKLGQTSLGPLDAVAGIDLNSIRQVWGHPIQGILGMDFLGRYVVHIDREKGELLLLKSAPRNAGVELPISWEPGDPPFVPAEIAPGERIRFMVDTGAIGLDSGNLGVFETGSMVGKGQFREIGKALHESISGTKSHLLFQGGVLSIGGFAVHSPVFSESYGAHPNTLGLDSGPVSRPHSISRCRSTFVRRDISAVGDRRNATGLHLWMRSD